MCRAMTLGLLMLSRACHVVSEDAYCVQEGNYIYTRTCVCIYCKTHTCVCVLQYDFVLFL